MSSFHALQHEFMGHLRNPEAHPPPEDVEPRRMQIYRDLFHNNIAGFLSQGFPVLHRILSAKALWDPLVRDFIANHSCASPYFVDIPKEFIEHLAKRDAPTSGYPPYLAELAHYEWLEMVLDIADDDTDPHAIDPDGDLLVGSPVLSPVYQLAGYHWPVTTIGPDNEPGQPLSEPLVVLLFRDPDYRVRFMEINTFTYRLIRHIADNPGLSGEAHLTSLSQTAPLLEPQQFVRFGADLLADFHHRGFILGTRMLRRQQNE